MVFLGFGFRVGWYNILSPGLVWVLDFEVRVLLDCLY